MNSLLDTTVAAAPPSPPAAPPPPGPTVAGVAESAAVFLWACPCCRATLRTLSSARRGSCPACGSLIEAPEPPASTTARAATEHAPTAAGRRRLPLRPALAVGGLALAAAAAFLLVRAQPWKKFLAQPVATVAASPPSTDQLREQLDRFLRAPNWLAKSPLILDAARLDKAGTAYYHGRDPDTIQAADFQPWSLPGLPNTPGIMVLRAERQDRRPVVAAFRQSGHEWRLDWELFTQTYDESLPHFLSSPSFPIRTFRARLSRVFPANTPENNAPNAPETTCSVELSDAFDPGQRMTINLPMGTPIMNTVASGLPGTTPREATVEVCWARPDPDGAWVPMLQKLVCWGWLGLNGSPETDAPAAPTNDRFLTPAAAPLGSPPPPAESTVAATTVTARP